MSIRYDDTYVIRPKVEHEYTEEEILELSKCSNDIYEFIKHVQIVHPDRGKITYEPYDYQQDLLKLIIENRFIVGMWCRQSGKSTTVAIYCLWYAIFNSNKNIGIVSNKEKSAKSILLKIKRIYETLPSYMKPGVVSYNKTSIEFDNETIITISATSPDAFRGETMNFLFCDEFAFVPKNTASDFWAANFPTISASKEAKIIIVSTPNGLFNLFHQMYTGAERGTNTFKHMFINWRNVPGRDEEWKEEQIKNFGQQKFNQEQECRFLGSANTLIDPTTLRTLANIYIDPIHTELDDKFSLYEKPVNGAEYVLGCDVAKGTGEHYSAIQILKLVSNSPIKMEQVAVYFNNMIDVYKFADTIDRIAKYYNNAWIMVENNSEGAAVVNRIWWDHENERLVNTSSKSTGLGVRASTKTKPRAVLLMKKLIEDGNLTLKDRETMDELSSFIEKNNKFFGDNKEDDLVSALYWACYIIEMNVLDENFEFRQITKEEEEAWGVIPDIDNIDNDWSWLNMDLRS
jgi:hypothetical protein